MWPRVRGVGQALRCRRGPLFVLVACLCCILSGTVSRGETEVQDREVLSRVGLAPDPSPATCNPQNTRNLVEKRVRLHMMSKTQRGADAVLALASLAREHTGLQLDVAFIADYWPSNTSFTSVNGPEEVEGDLWELCAIAAYPATSLKWLDFMGCVSQRYVDLPSNAISCAVDSGLNVDQMQRCVQKDAPTLLRASIARSKEAGVGASRDTVIFINGKLYEGPSSRMAFEKAICTDPIMGSDSSVFSQWWFYFLVAVGAVGGTAILIAGLFTAYRIYAKCNRASDMWLNMIKTNQNALDFEGKVQGAMCRYEKEGGNHDAARNYQPGFEEGRTDANRIPAHVYVAGGVMRINHETNECESPEGSQSPYLSQEDSPLLPSFATGWTMGGIQD